jgi:tRNA pseudouridine65 synthase
VIDHPVPRDEDGPKVPAVTEFRRLAIFERYALVEARPRTGRRHQIRRHFKHLSHPLIGDVCYGKGEHNRLFRERFGLHRLALHALELAFEHPETGEAIRIVAPVPEDLAGPLRVMGMEVPDGREPDQSAAHSYRDGFAKNVRADPSLECALHYEVDLDP